MKAAVCVIPVQLYDEELAGIYDVGDVVEGAAAGRVLEKYPEFFAPLDGEEGEK